MSKPSYLQKNYKDVFGIKLIVIIFFLIFFLTLTHNYTVSKETRGRDFQYKAWQSLTHSKNFLRGVKEGDVFISQYQNDAYETNAGSLYWHSGIRLTYLFKIDLLWPEYSKCQDLNSGCPLPEVREKVKNTVPNLQRGAFVPIGRDKQRLDDWVNLKSLPGALDKSTIWFFDPFLMTGSTFVAYLAPFDESAQSASIKLNLLRFISISKDPVPEFSPSIAGFCLKVDYKDFDRNTGLFRMYWSVPDMIKGEDAQQTPVPKSLDIRGVKAGTCATGATN